jgi:hypothetical protein
MARPIPRGFRGAGLRSRARYVAQPRDDFVEPGQEIAVHAAVARLERLADGEQVPPAELIRVDPEPAGDHVDLRFRGKTRLRPAKAAERTRRHRAGAHRIGARRDRVPAIGAGDAIPGLDDGHRAGIAVGAAIELDLALPRGQSAVRGDAGAQGQDAGMLGQG